MKTLATFCKKWRKNVYPFGWGQGDDIPLWEFQGNALKKRLWGTLFPTPHTKGQSPFEPLQEGFKKKPSGWGQGDDIPLWEFEGSALKKRLWGTLFPTPHTKGQSPFEPLQDGLD
jgi:hypothetical protein